MLGKARREDVGTLKAGVCAGDVYRVGEVSGLG